MSADLFDLTHEELVPMIAALRRQRDDLLEANNGYLHRARAAEDMLAARFGSMPEGHFAVIQLDHEPKHEERERISRFLSRFVEETSTRFLVFGPGMRVDEPATCDVCRRSLK